MATQTNWLKKSLDTIVKGATRGYMVPVTTTGRQYNLSTILKVFGFNYTFADWKLKDYVEGGYSRNAALYSVINRISRTAAMCPFKVYKVKDETKHEKYKSWTGPNATNESLANALLVKQLVYEEDNNHPLTELIDKPNQWQGGNEFTQNSVGFKLITGNRFLFKNVLSEGANQGRPVSIYNLPPQNIKIEMGGSLFEIKLYWLEGLNREPVPIPVDLILHSRYWNPNFDGSGGHLWGLSPMSAASRNADRVTKGEERSVSMLSNAGAAGLLFNKSLAELSVEQAAELIRTVNERLNTKDNAGAISAANGDLGYINFGRSAVELDVLNLEKWSMQQICNIYGVPYVLFSADNSSYNNIKEAKKELISMAVIPELASLRDDWNEIAKLYNDKEPRYVDYDLSYYPELQEDQEKTAKIMAMSWWIKPNEKRLAMNLDEDTEEEMMDEYLVPAGMTTLSDLNPANLDAQMNQIDGQQQQGND